MEQPKASATCCACRFGRWGQQVLSGGHTWCGMSVTAHVSHGPCWASKACRRIDAPGPKLAPLPRLPWASPPRSPALASLVWLRAPNAPALPLKGGPNLVCLLATSIYRENIKLLTVLPLLSLYQEGTVLLTFLQCWLKVVPEFFPEKKKRGVVVQGG